MGFTGFLELQAGNVRQRSVDFRTWDALARIPIARPPHEQQRYLADFLDAETARIDALIEKKRHLIELLDERRRSVIDGLTVPKALGGSADSGSRSPWPVTALKRSAAFFSDGDWIESPFITSEGVRLIQTGNVGEGEYREQGFRFVTHETFAALQCTEVFPGDILISRLAGPVGCACLAPNLGTRMIAAVDVAILRPSIDVNPNFVVAYLSSARHLALAELLARGTTMQRLSRSQVGDMPLPMPELHVQRVIAEKVARATGVLRITKGRLERQIALLREHRQALVAAAVTGQLDIAKAAA
jgi:type I restriction enzyme S subunit